MDITLVSAYLKAQNLSPSEYTFLNCYVNGLEYPYHDKEIVIKGLQAKLYIRVNEDGTFTHRHKMDDFAAHLEDGNSDSWIDEWRELFPKGVKSGARPVRGDKQGCIRKMRTFMRNNPKVTKAEIFEATKMYVFDKSRDHYKYMTCADYFINKDGSSMLAALIEDIQDNGNAFKDMEDGVDGFGTVI